jgi:hypothetical protein
MGSKQSLSICREKAGRHGFKTISLHLQGEGWPRFNPSTDLTHAGASSTWSALFKKLTEKVKTK